ncbi:hypothetical protein E3P99_02427 [Wallemia hederae]|uniref:Uncharacterized protein n=1 Tax=Wallemia hederae TaxID=1540922 RepID=A0A4T0FJQ1_9BASI|nr:hypothetical protein E3P99_02427 [Wallemia hederae]
MEERAQSGEKNEDKLDNVSGVAENDNDAADTTTGSQHHVREDDKPADNEADSTPSMQPLSSTKSIEETFDDAEEEFIQMEDHTHSLTKNDDVDVTPATTVEEFDKRMSTLGLRTPPDSSVGEDHENENENELLEGVNSAQDTHDTPNAYDDASTPTDTSKILAELAQLREENVSLMTSNEKYKQDCELIAQDLEAEKRQRVDAEEIIVQLRTRVEESRNGVMKLQQQQQEQDKSRRRQETESKRSSFILNEPSNLSKRASIKSHKRMSSMSADNAKSLKDLHLQPSQQQPASNRSSQIVDMTNLQMENANLSNEIQRMKKEMDALKEGKLSSENALKALREFMDSSGEDQPKGLKLPPLPTDEDVPTPTTTHKPNGSWFFGKQSQSQSQSSSSPANHSHESTPSQQSNASSNNDGGFDKPSTLRSISSFFGKN